MKKNSSLLLVSLVVLSGFASGCQKHLDFSKDKELPNTPLPGQTINCRIESIWVNIVGYYQEFRLVLYDEYENPIAITTPGIGTGHPYITFKYDSWHRLREYRGAYAEGFEFLHLYGYDASGRIGVDTGYLIGGLIISKIEYDNQNRIVKIISEIQRDGYDFEVNYNYDAAGNLMYAPDWGITYDNKVSLYRTNDIWMFLARDYSVNNRFIADAYNSSGFPTAINLSNPGYPTFLDLNIPLNNSQISYNCRQSFW